MRSLILALILAAPLSAQQPIEAPASPKVVVVQAGATERPSPVRIVKVAPPVRTAPVGAYEGTRAQRDWRWYGSGVARSRASYAIWRARFAPVNPYRYMPHVYSHAYSTYRAHTPRYYR